MDPDKGYFDGKVVLITGASRGIGRALAVCFGRAGANLVLVSRNQADLATTAGLARAHDRQKIVLIPVDIGERAAVKAMSTQVREEFGRLDVLVNNAGLGRSGSIINSNPDDVELMLRVNIWGLYLVTHYCLPLMMEPGDGDIVNIASVAGIRYSPGFAMYSATKFAVKAFSEGLRNEVQEKGVRVLTVHPGMTNSHFFDEFTPAGKPQVDTGAKRILEPMEVAEAIVQALERPANVAINELVIRPRWQLR